MVTLTPAAERGNAAASAVALHPQFSALGSRLPSRASPRAISITGTRGIPARHGGFETFAERLALHLVSQGWQVTVTCQSEERRSRTERWNGITLRHIPQWVGGPLGTIIYDLWSMIDTLRRGQVVLMLGYNTAVFAIVQRLLGVPGVINMDGLEWRRPKWSGPVRAWFYINERLAPRVTRHVVADHPVIAERLLRMTPAGRLSMIPYGADTVADADVTLLDAFGLVPDRYAVVIARPEPDNSILEIVTAFSRKRRGVRLCVLGEFDASRPYHREVMQAASDEVIFPGSCYDPARLAALRFYTRLYVHGHRFGGTNPSLVEALGAGCAVLAHDNPFNRWVAGNAMQSFQTTDDCAAAMDGLLADDADLSAMRAAARLRHRAAFTWPTILGSYEELLTDLLGYRTYSSKSPEPEGAGDDRVVAELRRA
jgi:glycosyltransferase involved in cell wall biosynthesis